MVNVPYCGPFQPDAPDCVQVHALVQNEWLGKGLAVSDNKIRAERSARIEHQLPQSKLVWAS
jgi:hypothetical protein